MAANVHRIHCQRHNSSPLGGPGAWDPSRPVIRPSFPAMRPQVATAWGARLGGQYSARKDIDLYASLAIESSDYGGAEPLFLRGGDDTFYELRAGLNYRPYPNWTVRPELRHARNDSNIPTSDFTRTTAQLSVRYDFD